MGRKILFIMTDMMRWDSLGYMGDPYARTPNLDRLAKEGILYQRAYNQNPLCMPSRSSCLTGQYPRTMGSWNNGIALYHEAPTFAEALHEQGYRTALIGKGHFEPYSSKHSLETALGSSFRFGPLRGFDYYIGSGHDLVPMGGHYTQWLKRYHPEYLEGYYYDLLNPPTKPGEHSTMNVIKGGETGAVFVKENDIPRELYHTDWTADHAIRYLNSVDDEEDWCVWLSLPDPHHPWDPPSSESHRVNWRDLDPAPGFGESDEQRLGWLEDKPWHWKQWYTGEKFISFEAVEGFSYQENLTSDNVREIRANIYISNELIDEAIGKVLKYLEDRGWLDDTDIFFSPDHGAMDGDYGLLLIGPDLTDHCCRLPLIWKPAKSANIPAAEVTAPVGLIDLAPTFCKIAGGEVPEWMEGQPLPASDQEAQAQGRETVYTQYESHTPDASIIMNAVYADGYRCIVYERSMTYEGTEGELYKVEEDPLCLVNLWDDPAHQGIKKDLIDAVRSDLLSRPLLHPLPEPGALI